MCHFRSPTLLPVLSSAKGLEDLGQGHTQCVDQQGSPPVRNCNRRTMDTPILTRGYPSPPPPPPPREQTNKLKILASRRITYTGGNEKIVISWLQTITSF